MDESIRKHGSIHLVAGRMSSMRLRCVAPRDRPPDIRGPRAVARGPLLPPGSSTNSTRLSRRRAAQRCCTGALRCSRRRSPAFRGCLTMLGCCFEPFLPASNASTGPRRREPDLLPGVVCRCRTDPRRSVAAFNPRECSRPLGCRSTAEAAGRAVLPPHPTCRPRTRNVVAGLGQVLHELFSRPRRSSFRTPAVAFQPSCNAFQHGGH